MTTDSTTLPLTPDQCRLARELLGWSVLDLVEASGVRMVTLMKIEDGRKPQPAWSRIEKVRWAFEEAGVEFVDGSVRRRQVPRVVPHDPTGT